jgi:hypothetical protein
VLGIALAPAPARAESSDSAKAEELIAKANELRRQGHDERALPMFREAYSISRTPRSAGQLGLVELALGYWDDASTYLTESLTTVRHHPWVDKNRAMLETALQTARSHLAELTVDGTPSGAELFLNGKSMGNLPLPAAVSVNEGRIEMEVRASGYKTDQRVLTLAGKTSQRIVVRLEKEAKATPVEAVAVVTQPGADDATPPTRNAERVASARTRDVPAAGDDDLPTWRRVLPWSLLAGAVVAGAFGIWQQTDSKNDLDSFDMIPGCGADAPMRGSDPRCDGLYQNFSAKRTRAFVGYGVAGALGAGAIGVFIWNAVSGSSASPAAPGTALIVGPREVAFSFTHSF